jgi:hypothetical protein
LRPIQLRFAANRCRSRRKFLRPRARACPAKLGTGFAKKDIAHGGQLTVTLTITGADLPVGNYNRTKRRPFVIIVKILAAIFTIALQCAAWPAQVLDSGSTLPRTIALRSSSSSEVTA